MNSKLQIITFFLTPPVEKQEIKSNLPFYVDCWSDFPPDWQDWSSLVNGSERSAYCFLDHLTRDPSWIHYLILNTNLITVDIETNVSLQIVITFLLILWLKFNQSECRFQKPNSNEKPENFTQNQWGSRYGKIRRWT